MPIPKPNEGESKNDFMRRCMGSDVMQTEYPDNDQRVAVCMSQFRRGPKEYRMRTVQLKGEDGKWISKGMSSEELYTWFEEHTKDGAVTEDIELFTEVEIKADEKSDTYDWTMSDMSLDRDMERMDPTGADFKNYKKNPVVLWAHDTSVPAIGKILHPSVKDGKVRGKVVFDQNDEFAKLISGKVRDGFLSAGSIGFKPNNVEFIEDSKDPTRLIHRKWELLEFSICNMPSNVNAVADRSAEAETGKTNDAECAIIELPTKDDLREQVKTLVERIAALETKLQAQTEIRKSLLDAIFAERGETSTATTGEMSISKMFVADEISPAEKANTKDVMEALNE